MKASEIKVGCYYTAKINGHAVTVRVEESGPHYKTTAYIVTNMRTGRNVAFGSPRRFRKQVDPPFDPPF